MTLRLLLAAALAAGTLTLAAQSTLKRELPDFDRVAVNHGIEVLLVRGDAHRVELRGDAEVLREVVTRVKGNALELTFEDDAWRRMSQAQRNGTVRATVTMPRLRGAVVNGGAEVLSEESWTADEVKIVANGGADLALQLDADELVVVANGGADVRLRGSAKSATFTVNGGADVAAGDLIAEDVAVSANGGADIEVHASRRLKANANGSADVVYRGGATDVKVNTNGGADVTKRG